MDLGQILVIVLFLLFSLVQFFLERRGGGRTLPPPPEDAEEERYRAEPREAAEPIRFPFPPEEPLPAPAPEPWMEGVPEEVTAEAPADEEAVDLAELRPPRPVEHVPEAVRVYDPVVSLEPLHVDRPAEHQRFHRRVAAPDAVAAPAPTGPSVAAALRAPGALRRAVLLAEVLGPPRSLR